MNEKTVEIPIIFEDNHVLVVEKPVNMPTQGDKTGDQDLLTILQDLIKERDKKPGNVYLGLVHRLDRPVGGIMVFAKNSKSNARLSDQLRTRKLDKSYLAVVHGDIKPEKGELKHHLLKIEKLNRSKVVKPTHPSGKEAVLSYEKIGANGGYSLIKIHLKTGRHHQIRVQLSEIGFPLYGDQKYGRDLNRNGWQMALYAFTIAFDHPVTGERKEFKSYPEGFPWVLFEKQIRSA